MATNEATMEYPVYSPAIPNGEEQNSQIEEAGEAEKVSFLDPDFLIFALPAAAFFDGLSIVLTIAAFFTLSVAWWIWLLIDVVAMIPIGAWIYWRTQRITEAKENKRKEIQENLQRRATALEEEAMRLERLAGREGSEEAVRVARLAAREGSEEAIRSARVGARVAGKIASRLAGKSAGTLLKIASRCLLKMIPLVGCIPFWTITVLETLKEK